jgi:CubicO group peptidase (beta-lactamase class C family)
MRTHEGAAETGGVGFLRGRLFLTVLLLALPLIAVRGQQHRPVPHGRGGGEGAEAATSKILEPAMQEKHFTGLAVGIVRNGQVVVERGFGVKSLDAHQVPDVNTVFYIGSLTKAMTAVGAMLLVERGKLDLQAPVSRYVRGLPQSWRNIAVIDFMAHQSGIPDLNKDKPPTFEEMLQRALSRPMAFPPGTKQVYNNFNYAIVGKVIESVSGESYLDFMKQNVLGPLHMDHTGYQIADANHATSYEMEHGRPVAQSFHVRGGTYGMPSGLFQSTVADLLKFYRGIQPGAGLLDSATYRTMTTRVSPKFSGTPGWFEKNSGGESVVNKDGKFEGFNSMLAFVPGKGDCVAMIWTSESAKDPGLFKVTDDLLHQVCGVPEGSGQGPDGSTSDED